MNSGASLILIEMFKKLRGNLADTWIGNNISHLMGVVELLLMSLYHDEATLKIIKRIIRAGYPLLVKPSELFFIYSLAKHQADIDGDYAEVGVFKGVTAQAICEAKLGKKLHLFDTFEGLPEIDKVDTMFHRGIFRADIEEVKKKLADYQNVYFHKGLFPETGEVVQDRKFSFIHLDVDLYRSTKDCLDFFYDRMTKGGMLISHDYHTAGVKKAFDEFFTDKPEKVIELPMSQCLVIKI